MLQECRFICWQGIGRAKSGLNILKLEHKIFQNPSCRRTGCTLIFKVLKVCAEVAELVDALDLKSNSHYNASAGSSPAFGTIINPYEPKNL